MSRSKSQHGFRYFASNLAVVAGVVLVWRGIWHILDYFDAKIFNGNVLPLAIIGIVVGVLILYIPDKDLKELGDL